MNERYSNRKLIKNESYSAIQPMRQKEKFSQTVLKGRFETFEDPEGDSVLHRSRIGEKKFLVLEIRS